MKWVRWKGIIAFVLIIGSITVFMKFFAGTLVKKTIEATGSRVVGARVDLAHAALSLMPLGVSLTGLQVTDPDEPMTNLFEVETTRISLEPGPLLLGKMIVDDMRVEGIRIKTPRRESGELPASSKTKKEKKAEKVDKGGSFAIPSFNLPDVKDVLAKEPLAVVGEGQALKKDMGTFRDDVEKRIKNLPDKEDFEAYEDRIKDLKPKKLSLGSVLGKLEELKTVEKDIRKDMDAIESLKDDVKRELKGFEKRLANLPVRARAEVERLTEKYAPTPQGMGNVSALFFGPKTSAWVTRGLSLYQKIQPYLDSEVDDTPEEDEAKEAAPERGKGVNVAFRESNPMPEVLVKHAGLSVNLEAGTLKGDLYQATNEQHITGQPMTFSFASTELSGIKELRIDGRVDRVKAGEPLDSLKTTVKGFSLDTMDLAGKSPMGIRISQAAVSADTELTLKKGVLDGSMVAALSPVTLTPMGEGGDARLQKALAKSLADVKALNIKGKVSGTVSDYRLNVSSDLDKVLKKVVNDMLTSLAGDFSKELEARVQEKTQEQVSKLTRDLDGLSGYDKELEKRLKLGRNALKGL